MIINSLLIALILFSPAVYGSAHILPLSIVESISFLIFFIFLFRAISRGSISLVKARILPLICLVFLVLFQFLSLPDNLLSFLSPSTAYLYREFKVSPGFGGSLSIYPDATIDMLLQFLAYLAVFFVILNHINTEKKARLFVFVIIASGILYSLYGIVLKTYLPGSSYQFSTFINRNHFAAYVEMIIPLTIAYSFIESSKSKRILFIFAASVMTLALFLSLSRAGRACFLISMALFFVILKIRKPTTKMRMAAVVLVLFLVIFVIGVGLDPIMKRMETLLDPAKAFSGRSNIFKDTLNIIRDFPIFGTGLGTFSEIAEKYKTLKTYKMYVFAHNEPLQLTAETGLLGICLALSFIFLYSKDLFFVWVKRHSPFAVYLTLGGAIGLFSAGFHSFFEFIFHVPADAMLFFIILALTYKIAGIGEYGSKYCKVTEIKLSKPARVSLICVLVVSFLFVEYIVLNRCRAQLIFENIKQKDLRGQYALAEIDKAMRFCPTNSLYLNKKGDLLSEIDPSSAEECYKKAININPARADYHLDLGHLYIAIGKDDLAQAEFRKASLLDPQSIRINSNA